MAIPAQMDPRRARVGRSVNVVLQTSRLRISQSGAANWSKTVVPLDISGRVLLGFTSKVEDPSDKRPLGSRPTRGESATAPGGPRSGTP